MKRMTEKLQQFRPLSADDTRRGFRRIATLAGILIIAGIIGIVLFVLATIAGVRWLVDRGNTALQDTGQHVVESVAGDVTLPNLDLASYATTDQLTPERRAQLEQTFAQLPSTMQDAWLKQYQEQLQQAREQTGISDADIEMLTTWYNTLQASQR